MHSDRLSERLAVDFGGLMQVGATTCNPAGIA